DVGVPDDRRRAAPAWQRELPGDVRPRIPFQRELRLAAHAVQLRAAPLRPVLSRQRRRGNREQDDREQCAHRSLVLAYAGRVLNPAQRAASEDAASVRQYYSFFSAVRSSDLATTRVAMMVESIPAANTAASSASVPTTGNAWSRSRYAGAMATAAQAMPIARPHASRKTLSAITISTRCQRR